MTAPSVPSIEPLVGNCPNPDPTRARDALTRLLRGAGPRDGDLASLAKRLGSQRRRALITAALFSALFAVGALDAMTGSDLSLAAFYVVGIIAIAIVAGRRLGLAASLLGAVLWGMADIVTSHGHIGVAIDAWNLVSRFAVNAALASSLTVLVDALDGARRAEATTRSFLAGAAHQLRTPVARLRASVNTFATGTDPVDPRAASAAIAGDVLRLDRLVGALLRLAGLDQGESLKPQPVDLRALCEDEIERARRGCSLKTTLTVAPGMDRLVIVDPHATREALGNILDNARHHAISAINVRLHADRNRIRVDVSDDGPGLPTGCEATAFERFVTLSGDGTGLGLSIARQLTRRQGGDVTYAAKTFRITLPKRTPQGA